MPSLYLCLCCFAGWSVSSITQKAVGEVCEVFWKGLSVRFWGDLGLESGIFFTLSLWKGALLVGWLMLILMRKSGDSSVLFDDYWLTKHCSPSSMHSLQAALTTAILFSTVSPAVSSDDCIQFCMLPRGWSLASDAMNTSHRHCVILFTGCQYHSASPSKLHWWCSTVLAAEVRCTLVTCTLLYTPLLHVQDYDQRIPQRPRRSMCVIDSFGLPQLLRAWSDNVEQIVTGFVKHRHQGTV